MKAAFLALLFTFFAVCVATIPRQNGSQWCRRHIDCGVNGCCTGGSKMPYSIGLCKPLSAKGDECDSRTLDRYLKNCPCDEGLRCEPREEVEETWGEMKDGERCVEADENMEETKAAAETEVPDEV